MNNILPPPNEAIVNIATIIHQVKIKFKVFEYIDDTYVNAINDGKLQDNPFSGSIRSALCNALFRNIILEIFATTLDPRSDVLAKYVREFLKSYHGELSVMNDEFYNEFKDYRHKIIAHKDQDYDSLEFGSNRERLKLLLEHAVQICNLFLNYYLNNLNSMQNFIVNDCMSEASDQISESAIVFFMKIMSGYSSQQITNEMFDINNIISQQPGS